MVINATTLEIINYTKDLDYSFNIKILLFIFLIVTAIVSLYYGYKDESETETKSFYNMIMVVYGYLVIFFTPLYLFFLQRTIELTLILNYVAIAYKIIFYALFLFGLIWGFERILIHLFGVSFKTKSRKRDGSEYREVER